jgi:hypothetical protein
MVQVKASETTLSMHDIHDSFEFSPALWEMSTELPGMLLPIRRNGDGF